MPEDSPRTARSIRSSLVRRWWEDAHALTLRLLSDLTPGQWRGPRLAVVNPFLWELGHTAWFSEHWILRHLAGHPPLMKEADALYDSSAVPHDVRWDLPLPDTARTIDYFCQVKSACLHRLHEQVVPRDEAYFYLLCLFHLDMHNEAFAYMRQTLSYPAPKIRTEATSPAQLKDDSIGERDVEVPGGEFWLGSAPAELFLFDNEKWLHSIRLAPFRISKVPVTKGQFAAFVDAGAYGEKEFWSDHGWRWRSETGADHPIYWERQNGTWQERRFDQWQPLASDEPVVHVNWHEANAYCAWANRRLPTEAEWEATASPHGFGGPRPERKQSFPWGDELPSPSRCNSDFARSGPISVLSFPESDSIWGCRQMIGNVWEWTASDFAPYPGFSPDLYKDYSQPWFGSRKVLRGGCWATRARLSRIQYRNFFPPERRDIFAGFRTCAQ